MNNIIELNQNEITTVAGGGIISHFAAGCSIIGGLLISVPTGMSICNNNDIIYYGLAISGIALLATGVDHFVSIGSSAPINANVVSEEQKS